MTLSLTHRIKAKPCVWFVCVVTLFGFSLCAAQSRRFPLQAKYCQINEHGLPTEATARVNGEKIMLSPALIIRDESNRIVVNSYLPQKVIGMCMQGSGGALEKIWIMTPGQVEEARKPLKQGVSP